MLNDYLKQLYHESSSNPLDEMRNLLIRIKFLKDRYNILNEEVYSIEWYLESLEREYKMKKRSMNEDIKKYDIFILTKTGDLQKTFVIESTEHYNHYLFNLHHYIKDYEKNKQWYDERGIKQKLILLPIEVHEQVHQQAVHNLSDDDFELFYKISRWDLLFNKHYSKY